MDRGCVYTGYVMLTSSEIIAYLVYGIEYIFSTTYLKMLKRGSEIKCQCDRNMRYEFEYKSCI